MEGRCGPRWPLRNQGFLFENITAACSLLHWHAKQGWAHMSLETMQWTAEVEDVSLPSTALADDYQDNVAMTLTMNELPGISEEEATKIFMKRKLSEDFVG